MQFRFSAMPHERKAEMAGVVKHWKETNTGVDVLREGLTILVQPGRVDKLRLCLSQRSPRSTALVNIAFTQGRSYQARGVLDMDDAQRLLDLVDEIRKAVPDPPDATRTAIGRVASILFENQRPPSLDPDGSWKPVVSLILRIDPRAIQAELF